jgi:hypothetical protein
MEYNSFSNLYENCSFIEFRHYVYISLVSLGDGLSWLKHVSEKIKTFICVMVTPHYVKWVPCHNGMAHLQVADGEDGLQICRVAANIENMQSRTGDKGWSSSLWFGRGANNSSP